MQKVSERQLAAIKVVVFDELCSLAKKFDKAVGDFVVFVKTEEGSDVLGVIVGFVNSSKLTPKDIKSIKKNISAVILKKFKRKVDVHLSNEFHNNVELEILNYNSLLNVNNLIPRHHFTEALRTLLQGEKEFFAQSLTIKIDQITAALYRSDSTKTFGDFQLDFIHLLWPTIDRVCEMYPRIVRKNALSIMTVREYAALILEEAIEVFDKSKALIDHLSGYALLMDICNELRHDSANSASLDEFNAFLFRCQNSLNHQTLEKLHSQYEKLQENNQRLIHAIQLTNGHMRVALSLHKKLHGFHQYLNRHAIAADFRNLIGIEWCPESEFLDECFNVSSWPKYEKIISELVMRSAWHDEISDVLPVLINSIEVCIDSIRKIEAAEAAEKKSEKLRLSKESKQAKQWVCQSSAFSVSSATMPEPKLITQPAESFTKSSKESAKEMEARLQAKQTARLQKRLSKGSALFDGRDSVSTAVVYSLRLTHLVTGVESELDLCVTAKRTPHSPYFVLLPNTFVLAEVNPLVMLTEQQRRLLHANEGRGFIGSVCHGQTGIKYVREGKDAYAIIKAASEERIFCAIKNCTSVALDGNVDLLIPMLAVPNHADYERLLQRSNIASWLRGQCDDQFLIEECVLEESSTLRKIK